VSDRRSIRYVAFVRAVMVGREGLHREVLTGIFDDAGGIGVRSHLATGNVSFDIAPDQLDQLVAGVEGEISRVVGRETPVFVRSQRQLGRLVASDPFSRQPYPKPRDLAVLFFRSQVPRSFGVPLELGDTQTVFAKSRRELFVATTDRSGGGHPGSPMGLIERLTAQKVTARAWSTVVRVASPG
jgi:uncharacterized protein (DUF1697 family)